MGVKVFLLDAGKTSKRNIYISTVFPNEKVLGVKEFARAHITYKFT